MTVKKTNTKGDKTHATFLLGEKGHKPTFDMYGFVQAAFDHFNRQLFHNQLPQCLLTFQREKRVMGYFSSDRWEGKEGTEHEIALNPYYFVTHNPLEIFQTIVHEMCHLWQHEFGKPSRSGYHNKEWAEQMESIGLMPSSTGSPGGRRTGQKMSDYPIDGGLFYTACVAFAKLGNQLPYVDRIHCKSHEDSAQVRDTQLDINDEAMIENEEYTGVLLQPFSEQFELDEEVIQEQEVVRAKKQKTVFQCPDCGDKAWGKPSLNLICGNCNVAFSVVQ